jgi:DNA-binding NarL/FixJ family response regulator
VTSVGPSSVAPRIERIRVLVAECNRMASQLMETVLQKHRQKFEVHAITSGASETFQELEKIKPDVAVISAELRDGSLAGFRVLQQLRNSKLNAAPVLLLNSVDRELVMDALRCGARGIFTRSHSIGILPKCICTVHSGQVWVDNEQIELLVQMLSRLRPLRVVNSEGMAPLTSREREVLGLVAEGMRNVEISHQLGVSEHTVRNYICHLLDKIGLSSRVELVLYALSR